MTMFEKRGAMPNRRSLARTLWLASSLVMLVGVLAAPIRTSGLMTASARPDCLRDNFALSPGRPTAQLTAAIASGGVLLVNALPSENEEQDRADALDEPRASFLILCFFRKISDRPSIALRSITSLYPLRC